MSAFTAKPILASPLRLIVGALLLGVLLVFGTPAQPAAASCGGTTTVGTEAELNTAIAAFNAVGAGTCVFTIQLNTNIALAASTTQINNTTANVSLVIDGDGFAVNGPGTSGSVRPFDIAANTTVTMNRITITGGNATGSGGGISNSGILTLANSTISGNNAANNGGGIYNVGTLTVTDSTITGNQATNSGGGVYSNALTGTPVLITGSTIYNNNAYFEYGGGVANVGGEMTISNSTISRNRVSVSDPVKEGGGIYNESRLTLDSVTITDNTRNALYNANYAAAQVTIQNSILANSSTGSHDCVNATLGTVNIVNPNLVETQNGCGSFTLSSDPLLGPLQDNGGPTQTHALLPGSPAIDAGSTTLTTDQRGIARSQGAADDIGAFEVACPAFPLNAATEAELNFAIGCYNGTTAAGVYAINVTADIDLTASTTTIDNATGGVSLVIEGGGFSVDGQNLPGVRPFEVSANTTATMNDITVTGGNATGNGGGILNHGTLTLADSIITGNAVSSPNNGSGIENRGTLVVTRSTISNNTAGNEGGGIGNFGALTVTDSTITGNTALQDGGGIYSSVNTPVVITGSTIAGNTATNRDGGGVFNTGNNMTIRNSTISGNVAGGSGGGIYNESILSLDSVTITSNTNSALYNANYAAAQVTIQNSILANSTGTDCVNVSPGTVTIANPNLVETENNCGSFTLSSDPQLGPLQNNGGPTFTHALLAGSPAINAGDTTLTTDQRGVARPIDTADDIGAYEAPLQTAVTLRDLQARNVTLLQWLLGLFQR